MDCNDLTKKDAIDWRDLVRQLDQQISSVVAANGFSEEAQTLSILRELIREQIPYENFNHSTDKIR